jgi:hypothetical protein
MSKRKDITGQTFNSLTAKGLTGKKNKAGALLWEFTCVCGNTVTTNAWTVTSGASTNCGCLQVIASVERLTKHGHHPWRGKSSPTYHSWFAMIQRCRNPKNQAFKRYGGAGIRVYEKWEPQKGGSFANFLADMGERPEGTTLGRLGDVGDYRPGNCTWQTHEEQVQTKRDKKNRLLDERFIPKPETEWAV